MTRSTVSDDEGDQPNMARTIRRFARWGPLIPLGVAGLLIAMPIVSAGPKLSYIPMIGPAIINLFFAAMLRMLRPLMLANADRWEAFDQRAEASFEAAEAAVDDTARIDREGESSE